MDFNITLDEGSVIEGYLIPDGFSSQASILVYDDMELLGLFLCDVYIESVVIHGRHSTGLVGFRLDEKNTPRLKQIQKLKIADANTGLEIYSRFLPEIHINRKVFRLETQLLSQSALDNSLKPHFQFFADRIEQHGHATAVQMLFLLNQPSVYLSGRVLIQNFRPYFTDEFISVASIRDPFYELAIRLLTVSQPRKKSQRWLSKRDNIIFEPAFNYFFELDMRDEKSVKKRLNSAPKDILFSFQSPFTHQLVAKTPTDNIGRDGIVLALDQLSEFDLFHAEENTTALADDIAELLDLPRQSVTMNTTEPVFLAVTEMLSSITWLEQLLENDLILYHFVQQAKQKSKRIQ